MMCLRASHVSEVGILKAKDAGAEWTQGQRLRILVRYHQDCGLFAIVVESYGAVHREMT